jgi:hypothetical protein
LQPMLAIENVAVLLCFNSTPMMVSGAETIVTQRSAAQSANKSGFFTRVVDCEQSDISSVELPKTPLNTTMPYRMINVNNDNEVRSSPLASSNSSLSVVVRFKGNAVVELVLVINEIFLVEFLIATFMSHCVSSILFQFTLCEDAVKT